MMFVRPCCLPVFVLCRILDDKSNMASRVCSLIEAKIKLAMVVSVIDNEDQSCVYRFLLVTAPLSLVAGFVCKVAFAACLNMKMAFNFWSLF